MLDPHHVDALSTAHFEWREAAFGHAVLPNSQCWFTTVLGGGREGLAAIMRFEFSAVLVNTLSAIFFPHKFLHGAIYSWH
jgi:hypothetical protein